MLTRLTELDLGLEMLKKFKEHPNLEHVPFVFVSGLTEMRDLRMGMNLGADDYLTKPFRCKELISVVDRLLSRETSRPSA